MRTLIDFDDAPVFAVPAAGTPGGPAVAREGMLIEGPQGWGEFSPPPDADDAKAVRWLTAAVEAGTVGWPDVVRGRVRAAVAVPATDPAAAHAIAAASGCRAADIAVARRPGSLAQDRDRVAAVRDALGPGAALRCDAGGNWDVQTAVAAIAELDRAAGGLEFIEQPCRTRTELAAVRRRIEVPVAADESLRDATGLADMNLGDAADLAVLHCGPLGGVRRALRIAEASGKPCVVAAAAATSIGLAAGLALAGALPDLPYACGLGTPLAPETDLVSPSRSLIPVDGALPVAPLAPAPDPGQLARYRLDDAGRVGWWRDRLRRALQSG